MKPNELKIGSLYRIKDSVEIKVCSGPMTYTGTQLYRDVIYHNFWDAKLRLAHWINPEDMEPV